MIGPQGLVMRNKEKISKEENQEERIWIIMRRLIPCRIEHETRENATSSTNRQKANLADSIFQFN
jgi:hypothetical protein